MTSRSTATSRTTPPAANSRSGRPAPAAPISAWSRRCARSRAAPVRRRSAMRASGLASGFGMINYDRGLASGAAILAGRGHDRTDRKAAPEAIRSCGRGADVAAARAQPRVAWFYAGRRRRAFHAAALRRLRGVLLSGARCVLRRAFPPICLCGRAAARHASERNHAARSGRRAFPRACAMARRAGRDGMRADAGDAPACRLRRGRGRS